MPKFERELVEESREIARLAEKQVLPMECSLVQTTALWIRGLVPKPGWSAIAHFTFALPRGLFAAQKHVERFLSRKNGLSYFYALEENPGLPGCYHCHALLHRGLGVYRREMWHEWFTRYGRCLIEPPEDIGDCSGYCAKYACKAIERGWWNLKILGAPRSLTAWYAGMFEGKPAPDQVRELEGV